MATETDALLKRISDYLAWLHVQWGTFCALFAHSQGRIDELNRRTGDAFRIFQDSLLDSILLEVAKLLDPPRTCGKENLSFAAAIERLAVPAATKAELEGRREQLRSEVDAILRYRHQRIAHNDQAVALDPSAGGGVSRAQVREAIAKVARFHDAVRGAHQGEETSTHYRNLEEDAERDVGLLMKVVARGNAELDREARARRDAWVRLFGSRGVDEDFDPGESWVPPGPPA